MSQSQIKISDIIAPAFRPLFSDIQNEKHFEYWLKGGRHSTKSAFLAICIIYGIMHNKDANAIVLRHTQASLRNSVLSTLVWAINILGVSHLWDKTVSPMELTYKPTGQKIFFSGLDDPAKLKGFKVEVGYFKYIWFEELAEMDGMASIRSVKQTMIRGSNEKQIVLYSYNPPRDPQSWVNKEAENVSDRRFVHHSTYLDVPAEWLGQESINEAERLRAHDETLYQCEYMGLSLGLTDSVVLNGTYIVEEFEAEYEFNGAYMGADWGFSQDPTALTKSWIAPHAVWGENCLYIEYEAGDIGVDLDDLHELFDKIPAIKKYTIRADCARPETISYMNKQAYKVLAAKKWKGSVEDGVAYLRAFDKIIIHPRCTQTIIEFRLYSYKIDKLTKDISSTIIDAYNHYIDSLRYALQPMISKKLIGYTRKQVQTMSKSKKTTTAPRENEVSW